MIRSGATTRPAFASNSDQGRVGRRGLATPHRTRLSAGRDASSVYLGAYRDKDGDWLDGGSTYRLRVPPDPPGNLFWSLTLYDLDPRSLLLNEQKIADRSSRMDLRRNGDGSVDLWCGPAAPEGFEQNWIPTVPGKGGFAYFRLHEPTDAYFDASWPLPDFEPVG